LLAVWYIFKEKRCGTQGGIKLGERNLLAVWYIFKEKRCGMQGGIKLIHSTLHTSHLYRMTSTKCCVDTVISADDGHIIAQNM